MLWLRFGAFGGENVETKRRAAASENRHYLCKMDSFGRVSITKSRGIVSQVLPFSFLSVVQETEETKKGAGI